MFVVKSWERQTLVVPVFKILEGLVPSSPSGPPWLLHQQQAYLLLIHKPKQYWSGRILLKLFSWNVDNFQIYTLRLLLIPVNMHKVVMRILQGSTVTQTVLGGLTIYVLFLWFPIE